MVRMFMFACYVQVRLGWLEYNTVGVWRMVRGEGAWAVCVFAASAILLSEKMTRKRKMRSKMWYLKRNISCDADLLNELLETDVP